MTRREVWRTAKWSVPLAVLIYLGLIGAGAPWLLLAVPVGFACWLGRIWAAADPR